jgi:hypothetical protein
MSRDRERAVDCVYGDWQRPINRWQGANNSIHTDAVARKVGLRGGTVPGSSHLGHFRPILTDLFGERWYRSSCISMFYTYATVDGEEVRAVVKAPASNVAGESATMVAWVETRDGKVVCKGTLSVGQLAATPYIRSLPLVSEAPGSGRILSRMRVGDEAPVEKAFTVPASDETDVLRDPVEMFRALRVDFSSLVDYPAVGLYGATELTLHAGPIMTGVPYRKSGKVVCVGSSPKTEFAWFDSWLCDGEGALVAEMRHLTRWMKVSSPLWAAAPDLAILPGRVAAKGARPPAAGNLGDNNNEHPGRDRRYRTA